MKLHEYQSKKLFSDYGIPTEKNMLCYSVEEAITAQIKIGSPQVVVKAQVLTGGRGKAGGIKVVSGVPELKAAVNSILGMDIKGYKVESVLISEAVGIAAEYYVSLLTDRNTKSPLLMFSTAGGMDIEDVAKETPERIIRQTIEPTHALPDFAARRMAFALFDDMQLVRQMELILQRMYRLFIDNDASLVEINPLVLTKDGRILAVDAKVTIDDNALFRHPQIASVYSPTPDEEKEREAKDKGLTYIRLDGEIGCMVNGAGLAMATMDMIRLNGGYPANFLDIGGSSSPSKISEAVKLLLSDKQVQVVLINIFGGITRCDDVAKGLLQAFESIRTEIPIVVRLTGTNEKEGRSLLNGTRFHLAETMEEATGEAVRLATQNKLQS